MADYELLGQKLGHSFSKPIHEALGAYRYALKELSTEADVAQYLAAREFKGCNVTIPYKQTVIPFLDAVDDRAAAIGSVNTIVNRHGLLTGYNTDYDGFAYLLRRKNISLTGKNVLLLGNGGTARTVRAVAQDAGAKSITTASRNPAAQPGNVSYEEAARLTATQVIINVSPVGMYPNNGQCPIDVAAFPQLEAAVDAVYNPLKTRFLLEAEKRGVPTASGLPMLVEQAVSAARHFTGLRFDESDTERILCNLYDQQCNLVLIGMPSCGKSKLGRALANKIGKVFVDLDILLEEKYNRKILDIFAQDGEKVFRRMESDVLAEESKTTGRILSTGGGVVTQPENWYPLRQNGPVIYIDRPLEDLLIGGNRPLSTSTDALAQMYRARHPLYAATADDTVFNNGRFGSALFKLKEAYYASLHP